jgi:hypothetical protein
MPPAAREETASESGHRGHLSPLGVPENPSRFRRSDAMRGHRGHFLAHLAALAGGSLGDLWVMSHTTHVSAVSDRLSRAW